MELAFPGQDGRARALDDTPHLDLVGDILAGARTGKNGRHALVGMLRQSVFGRLAGYENVNDAERLRHDPAMRWIVGGKAASDSPSQMGRFDTSLSVTLEESGGQLLSGTAADAQNDVTLCLVDNELLAYRGATLLAAPPPNSYNLTGLVPGSTERPPPRMPTAFRSPASTARSSSTICRRRAAVFEIPELQHLRPSVEDLSECAVYPYTPGQNLKLLMVS